MVGRDVPQALNVMDCGQFSWFLSKTWPEDPIGEDIMYLSNKIRKETLLTWKLHSYWLAFTVPQGAMHVNREKK